MYEAIGRQPYTVSGEQVVQGYREVSFNAGKPEIVLGAAISVCTSYTAGLNTRVND
jgi:hypothetical protein